MINSRYLYQFILLVILLSACSSYPTPVLESTATIFYTSANGAGSQNGTSANPWKWSDIPTKISNGDIPFGSIIKLTGAFTNIQLTNGYSGSTFANTGRLFYDGSLATFSGALNFNTVEAVIHLNGVSNVSIKNFTIANHTALDKNETPIGIYLQGASSGVKIENNIIYDLFATHNTGCKDNNGFCGNAHGILIREPGAALIFNVWVTGNTLYNLHLGASEALAINGHVDTFYIRKNVLYDMNNIAIDAIGYEDGSIYTATNGWIEDNTISRVDARGALEDGEEGFLNPIIPLNMAYINSIDNDNFVDESASCIYVDAGKTIRIRRNKLDHCNLGISVASEHDAPNRGRAAQNVIVANNIIRHSSATGLKLGSGDGAEDGVTGCWILNNTLYQNDQPDNTGDDFHDGIGEIWMEYNVYSCRVVNNILFSNSLNDETQVAFKSVILTNSFSTAATNNNNFERNVYFHTNNTVSTNVRCQWGINFTLINYANCIGVNRLNDLSASYVDPQLSSIYALTASSPSSVVDSGLNTLGSTNLLTYIGNKDVFGGVRLNGAIDIGADER